MRLPASVRVACLGHRAVQRVLPAAFRRTHGPAMEATFAEHAVERRRIGGAWGVAQATAEEMVDLLRTAARLRVTGRGRGRTGDGDRRRDAWHFGADLRHAVRLWRRSPGLTGVTVATLGLGIGAATAMWTVADGVLFRPLPHANPEALVWIAGTSREIEGGRLPMSYPNIEDLRADPSTGFSDMAIYAWPRSVTAIVGGAPESLRAVPAGGNLFALLGNEALLGRTLRPADTEPGAHPVVVLSEGLWKTRFGGSAAVLGSTIRLDGAAYEVIGVMPQRFAFPWQNMDLWIPFEPTGPATDRDTNFLNVIGRLAEGVTIVQAQTRMDAAMARLVAAYPADNAGKGVRLTPRHDAVVGSSRPMMLVFAGASGLLLLLSCANLANLQLARSAVRRPELALRAALGAGRRRLLHQLVTENLALVVLGGVVGIVVARGLVDVLLALAPSWLPRRGDILMDVRALGFAVLATLSSGILMGVLPALRTATADPGDALREAGRGTGGRSAKGLRLLVVAQLAIALVLVSSGSLLVNSFARLLAVDPGFDPDGLYTFRLAPPQARYSTSEELHAFYDALLADIASLPGVSAVAGTWALPFTPYFASGRITVEGQPKAHGEEESIGTTPVRGDYFGAMGLSLLSGRSFVAADTDGAPPVVVINETAAKRFWPGEDAVGKRLRRGRAEETDLPWITVIGVVEDARRTSLAAAADPELYWNHPQAGAWARDMSIVVRATGDPNAIAAPVRELVRRHAPDLAVTESGLLTERIGASVAEPRFRALLLGAFSGLALLLAAVGTYGVMAFFVAQRRQEIGVRMALGANGARVLRGTLADGARLIVPATVLGLAGALLSARALRGLLFGVQPLDPMAHGAALLLLASCALLACWLPARRASRVDPMTALRD
jgi:putative ABC transport system permease protein